VSIKASTMAMTKYPLARFGGAQPPAARWMSQVKLTEPESRNVTVRGADKHRIGLVAAEIRKLRPPEPYKGKGIKYAEETIRRKQGKTGAA